MKYMLLNARNLDEASFAGHGRRPMTRKMDYTLWTVQWLPAGFVAWKRRGMSKRYGREQCWLPSQS
jgi:hypothetical protein